MNTEPIHPKTKSIQVRIKAEEGFNPYTDIDIRSLRFGASEEVNYGRGCSVLKTEKDGNDLIVIFDAKEGHGVTEEEFVLKLIGRSVQGKFYGYTRLPHVDYNALILLARAPVFLTEGRLNVRLKYRI